MEQITIAVDADNDNDSVLHDATRLYNSNGENGWDGLLDALNGAYSADRRITRAANGMGRASLHAALELLESGDATEQEHKLAMMLLAEGIVLRATKLMQLKQ